MGRERERGGKREREGEREEKGEKEEAGEGRGERGRWKKTELTRRFGAEHVPRRSTKRPEV